MDLPELWHFFSAVPNNMGATIVVDRMGRLEVNQPVDGPEFERFRRFMHDHARFYIKVSCPERFSISGQRALLNEHTANTSVLSHLNVIPFARRIVRTFSDRPLWGTDWPHPNLLGHMPDDGLLVDFIRHIARTLRVQQKLLLDNAIRL